MHGYTRDLYSRTAACCKKKKKAKKRFLRLWNKRELLIFARQQHANDDMILKKKLSSVVKRKHATQHHSRELQSVLHCVAMREIPDSRLPLTDRCLFCSRCLDRGRRNRFTLFVLMDSSNMLPLRKASLTKRGLRLLWSNSKGFPHLTTTAQCLWRCQNTEQAWPPTFLPKPFFFFYNAHLSADCHSEMLSTPAWSIVTFKKKRKEKKETSDHQRGWYRHLLPYMSRWEWSTKARGFILSAWNRKTERQRAETTWNRGVVSFASGVPSLCTPTYMSGQQEQIPAPQHHR